MITWTALDTNQPNKNQPFPCFFSSKDQPGHARSYEAKVLRGNQQDGLKTPRHSYHQWQIPDASRQIFSMGNLRGPGTQCHPSQEIAGLIKGIINHHDPFIKPIVRPYFLLGGGGIGGAALEFT